MHPVTLIYGKSFTGKTARLLYALRNESRVVLVDGKCAQLTLLGDYGHVWPEYDAQEEKWHADPELRNVLIRALRDLKSFRLCFHFRFAHRENLELLCGLLLKIKNCVLAVDEVSLFCPSGGANSLPPLTTTVVTTGTHDGLYFWGTVQRPSLVHINIRANAGRLLVYRMTEHDDLDVLRGRVPEQIFSQIETLPNYECVDYSDDSEPFIDRDLAGKLAGILPDSRT